MIKAFEIPQVHVSMSLSNPAEVVRDMIGNYLIDQNRHAVPVYVELVPIDYKPPVVLIKQLRTQHGVAIFDVLIATKD